MAFAPLRRVALLSATLSLCILCGGCGARSEGTSSQPRTTPAIAYPMVIPVGSHVLYRAATNRLVTFDPIRKVVNGTGNAPQTFQYPFPGRQDLLTSGSSTEFGFSLLRVTDDTITTLVTLKTRQGLFPLASEGDDVLLLVQDYDAANHPTHQQVVRLEGRSLVPVARLNHAGITGGALLDGVLSYTVLHRHDDRYDLRRVDLRDAASRPRTVRSDLRHGQLQTFRGKLVVDDRVPQSRSGDPVACDYYCLFSDAAGVVVTIAPDDNADLALVVRDPVSGRTYGHVSGAVVGFTLSSGTLDVYGVGLHERIAIPR